MSYTDNTILISDLTNVGSIYVYTRKELLSDQLQKLEDIAGVTSYSASGKLATAVRVRSDFSRSYTNRVSTGRVFTFEELAPQLVLVFADALGIGLDQLDLRIEEGGLHRERDASGILEAARKLRKPPTERNPRFAHAATLDDVVNGVELLTVGTLEHSFGVTTFTPSGEVFSREFGDYSPLYVPGLASNARYATSRSLADMGVVRYGQRDSSGWNKSYMTIVNTPEKRRELVKWLLELDSPKAPETASRILELYPTDFTATVTVKDGKLAAEVI